MQPGIKKAASRKTMRVAAVFTGAAACAAAFAPGAMAGTAPRVPAIESHGGNIQGPVACSPVPHWLHFRAGAATYCFGFAGYTSVPDLTASKICGGTNFGFYYGNYKNAQGRSVGYSAGYGSGRTYVPLPHVPTHLTQVSIVGWSGNDTCSV
jgi:hypothetical protein